MTVMYPCACQVCECDSKVAEKGFVCSLCRVGTHQKENGEIKMTEENEDHGLCKCCETKKAVVSILKTGLKVCLACAPKFI